MDYDMIIVGGGLAGSSLADQVARSGRRVLVLEWETRFPDRVRGENMLSSGVAAARRLGIHDDLLAAGARRAPLFSMYVMGTPTPARDMRATTPGGDAMTNMYHPHLQETLLARAATAGADVVRGATVTGIDASGARSPAVAFEHEGRSRTRSARTVVGADGRASQVRSWCGFEVRRSPDHLMIAGLLLENTGVPDDSTHMLMGPGCASYWAPLGGRRSRAYFIYPGAGERRGLSGSAKVPDFVESLRTTGAPDAWLAGVEAGGPLAEFNAADRWVDTPARHGVALVGDAATASNPSWGCGLSLSLLDVEHLANALREHDDTDEALDRYATEHDEYAAALHRMLEWMTELVWSAGPEADDRRARVFPRMLGGEPGFPDPNGVGPSSPSDERARRLTLGLE